MRTVNVDRYVTPLREGGSLPAIVEADDDGLYVLKFVGAGQGARALVAELISGEIARVLGLPVPEIVLAELDGELARTEADAEIQALIRASVGTNLALDYLPGSLAFDPAAETIDADLASRVVWFDAFITNVDRTARNTNLLIWHRRLWLIDHGASLVFHHGWDGRLDSAAKAFPSIKDHVLLPVATTIAAVDAELAARLTPAVFETILAEVPDHWLTLDDDAISADLRRRHYVDYFLARLAQRQAFVEGAIRARG
ncbi:MAG: HipA family kinase [Tahibacter sp.]